MLVLGFLAWNSAAKRSRARLLINMHQGLELHSSGKRCRMEQGLDGSIEKNRVEERSYTIKRQKADWLEQHKERDTFDAPVQQLTMLPLTARTASQNNARPLKGKGIAAHDAKHVHESNTIGKKEIFKPSPQND